MAQLTESRTQLELRSLELQRLSGRLVHLQDEERRRLSRELHDDLGQELVALKLSLDTASPFASRAEAVRLAENALAKIRNLSYVLHPPLLDDSGLLPALHLFTNGLTKRSSLRITLDCKPDSFPRLPNDIETSIFRVIQEAITNVQRHSGSTDARVEVHVQTDRVFVRVRDFGVGMPIDSVTGGLAQFAGVGLSSLRERVKQLGGEVNIIRAEPGTLVEAVIPLFP